MKKFIYLAGPIAGLNEKEATTWRDEVHQKFPYNIVGISPLRCEPLKEGMTYTSTYDLIKRGKTIIKLNLYY